MNFATAMREERTYTYTENGAKAKNTSGDDCLDFFSTVGSIRTTDLDRKYRLFDNAYNEDALSAIKILFYARDIREGLGERDTFRTILKHAANKHPDVVAKNIQYIPHYGRWDDLYALIDTPCEDEMWMFMKANFESDLIAYRINSHDVSLLAKWIRSGNESSKKSRALGILTAQKLGYKVYDFKRLVTKLRKYLDVVESKMSTNRWDEINYSHVPSRASMLYRDAFYRHDEERYTEYVSKVASGEEKINTSTLYPYDIVSRIWRSRNHTDETLETMWNNLPDYVGGDFNAIVVADTSGSMMCSNGRPFFTAISLAIYFAQRNRGAYKDLWMTFSKKPQYQYIKGDSITEIIRNFDIDGWGMNTNLEAAFDMILRTAIVHDIPKEDIPKSIIVISDMEIDSCDYSGWSFYNYMEERYREKGYTIPNVVFWNVNSRHDIFHADSTREGVQLVSGQSASTFKTLMKSIGMTPKEYMYSVINSERYDRITL